jgi:hypothetical protein
MITSFLPGGSSIWKNGNAEHPWREGSVLGLTQIPLVPDDLPAHVRSAPIADTAAE